MCLKKIQQVTIVRAKGRGSRQMCKPDRFGFPRTAAKAVKRLHGFQTGDRVRLVQPSGKHVGVHEGVVSIRATGMFDLKANGVKITAKHDRFTLLSRFDGYTYSRRAAWTAPDTKYKKPPGVRLACPATALPGAWQGRREPLHSPP